MEEDDKLVARLRQASSKSEAAACASKYRPRQTPVVGDIWALRASRGPTNQQQHAAAGFGWILRGYSFSPSSAAEGKQIESLSSLRTHPDFPLS